MIFCVIIYSQFSRNYCLLKCCIIAWTCFLIWQVKDSFWSWSWNVGPDVCWSFSKCPWRSIKPLINSDGFSVTGNFSCSDFSRVKTKRCQSHSTPCSVNNHFIIRVLKGRWNYPPRTNQTWWVLSLEMANHHFTSVFKDTRHRLSWITQSMLTVSMVSAICGRNADVCLICMKQHVPESHE